MSYYYTLCTKLQQKKYKPLRETTSFPSVMQNEEINCQIFVKFGTGVCLQKVVKQA